MNRASFVRPDTLTAMDRLVGWHRKATRRPESERARRMGPTTDKARLRATNLWMLFVA